MEPFDIIDQWLVTASLTPEHTHELIQAYAQSYAVNRLVATAEELKSEGYFSAARAVEAKAAAITAV